MVIVTIKKERITDAGSGIVKNKLRVTIRVVRVAILNSWVSSRLSTIVRMVPTRTTGVLWVLVGGIVFVGEPNLVRVVTVTAVDVVNGLRSGVPVTIGVCRCLEVVLKVLIAATTHSVRVREVAMIGNPVSPHTWEVVTVTIVAVPANRRAALGFVVGLPILRGVDFYLDHSIIHAGSGNRVVFSTEIMPPLT